MVKKKALNIFLIIKYHDCTILIFLYDHIFVLIYVEMLSFIEMTSNSYSQCIFLFKSKKHWKVWNLN